MLSIEHLTKRFGSLTAIDDLSLRIPSGEIFGFIGPNGAGKTTTLKICTGLMKPTAGTVTINGIDVQRYPGEAKKIIGYVSDQPYVYPLLTGNEFLRFIGELYRVPREHQKKKIPEFIEMFELTSAANELIESYSHGMKQKLVIAGVLLHSPHILFLDEPMVGLDPKTARLMKQVFQEYAKRGVSIFMSTHILEIAEKICHRVGIIHQGRLISAGTINDLRAQAAAHSSLEDIFLEITRRGAISGSIAVLMIFIRLHWRMFWNSFNRLTFAQTFKHLFFLSIGMLLLTGLYGGFYRVLSYVATVPIIGQLLILKLTSLVFLSTFAMVIISSLVAGFSTIYFSSDLHLLVASPLSMTRVFSYKAIETAVYASWMILLAIIPFFMAYSTVKGWGPGFTMIVVFLAIPYLAIAASIGIMLGTGLVTVFPSRRLRDSIMVLVVLLGSGIYIMFRLLQPEQLIRPDVFEQVLQYVSLLQAPTAWYLPSWWISAAVQALGAHEFNDFFFYVLLLAGSAFVCVWAMISMARATFFNGWARAQEASRSGRFSTVIERLIRVRSAVAGVIKKDITIFIRDVNQWTQLLLLCALVVVYIFSIYKLPLDTPYLKSLIAFLNIGMVGFVMSAVALRLVFPAMSLEGKSYWIIAASPLPVRAQMRAKFLYAFPVILLMGCVIVIGSNQLLGVDRFTQALGLGSVIIMAVTFSGLGIGMGSIFPYFKIENIARIESSLGGIVYMAGSFFFIGLVLAINAVPLRIHLFSRLFHETTSGIVIAGIALSAMAVIGVSLAGIAWYWGEKKLESYEL